MQYIGIHTQQVRNNTKSLLLLVMFPCILGALVYALLMLFWWVAHGQGPIWDIRPETWEMINMSALKVTPWILGCVAAWFCIAYFSNTAIIKHSTGAVTLQRKDNPRVYNIVENLTMACGMNMPKINIIDTTQLNAFASGIDNNSYTVTLTTGICDRLDDEELTGVVAHELTHIRNRDTRLLITSIIFVGIMGTMMQLAYEMTWRNIVYNGWHRRSKDEKNGGISTAAIMAIALAMAALAYILTLTTRFAISRKREYMADAGGAEMCGNPHALASALRKISNNPGLGDIGREDIAQLYICHPKTKKNGILNFLNVAFNTHPSIESRIAYLEQF